MGSRSRRSRLVKPATDEERFPYAARVDPAKAIPAKLRPQPVREPLPSPFCVIAGQGAPGDKQRRGLPADYATIYIANMKSAMIGWTSRFSGAPCACGSGVPAHKCCWRGIGRWEKSPVGITETPETHFVHESCYLSPLGNCGAKMTREHFISRNILERITTSTLKFENAAHFFGGKATVEIGVDAFSSKVLCDSHNSALSGLESAAGLAFSTIELLAANFVHSAASPAAVKSFHIASGLDMERWLLKVYCGLVAAGKIRTLSGNVLRHDPLQAYLLQSIMGNACLCAPLGLHIHSFVGQRLESGRVSFGTIKLTDGSDEVGGLILSLGVMNFVLITSPKFGFEFSNPSWHRHQTLAWNIRQGKSRLAFLFTY